jgi:hypothetical protein
MALMMAAYFNLPSRYQLRPDWQDAAVMVMISSIVVIFYVSEWREVAYWISLAISSAIHLFVAHAITRRIPNLSSGASKGLTVLGLVIFAGVYYGARFLQRSFYGTSGQAGDDARIE